MRSVYDIVYYDSFNVTMYLSSQGTRLKCITVFIVPS
jgi:hypothetical protein